MTRAILEKALDFFVALEFASYNIDGGYDKISKIFEEEMSMADGIVRQYAKQLKDKSLSVMQERFYSITNSLKYKQSGYHSSTVYSTLNSNWRGVGEWK
ncbi:MAG: hypothetical protein PVI26_00290 [Chitinispirillia bacterium]